LFGAVKKSHFFRKLFGPNFEACSFCQSRFQSPKDSNRMGLCTKCWNDIPWIREVKCAVCGRHETCYDCRRRNETYFVMNRSAVCYSAEMKAWLARYKYRGDERLLQLFAAMLIYAYHKLLETEEIHGDRFDYITFVPLSDQRLLERGFNQAELLAREVGMQVHTPVIALLNRVIHTDKQSFKRRSERLLDLGGVFTMSDLGRIQMASRQSDQPLRILLIDDVFTTGSTLNQCASVIREHIQAQIYGLTWAR
jgi:competence protein ComFC